jgi:dihydrofolate reductase
LKAIAAMSLNRVIGANGRIPWHLPEDFRWFKKTTLGHTVVMGRKTYESLGKPLASRTNVVLSRGGPIAGVQIIASLHELAQLSGEIFVIGGAEIYRQLLPTCDELLLTLVLREVEGDTFFPPFEGQFELVETVEKNSEFEIRRYRRG